LREDHWVIADLVGKAGHVRTVPVPLWVKKAVDTWTESAHLGEGRVFRSINKAGRIWGDGMTPKVLWEVVKDAARQAGIEKLAPHDLRRTCARLCHLAGGELDQIQFLLGHVSIQTTERYLGCKQKLRVAMNDKPVLNPARHSDGWKGAHRSPLGDFSRVIPRSMPSAALIQDADFSLNEEHVKQPDFTTAPFLGKLGVPVSSAHSIATAARGAEPHI